MTKQVYNNQYKKWKTAIRSLLAAMILSLVFTSVSFAEGGGRYLSDKAWSFGVHGDTQWTAGIPGFDWAPLFFEDDPAGNNPWFVSLSISDQIDVKMIEHGVKFVIQVGDLTNWAGADAIAARAVGKDDPLDPTNGAQDLYDAGIGFFPMRGNHETYGSFFASFNDPEGDPTFWFVDFDPDKTYSIPEIQENFPQNYGAGDNVFGAKNFSSPILADDPDYLLEGISYSFDYGKEGNNARFVIADPWATADKLNAYQGIIYYGHTFVDQQAWIDERIDINNRGTEHAFVFSHQPLMGEDHGDTPFGGNTYYYLEEQKAFFKSLQENEVDYYISGHDHLHQRSILTSPNEDGNPELNGEYTVETLIAQSASSKFYAPAPLNAYQFGDGTSHPNQKGRETSVSQELFNVGYYVYTIDGPRVNVSYYADETGGIGVDDLYPYADNTLITPEFNFVKKESWGYSLNGQKFLIAQGASYDIVQDSFHGSEARILAGTNGSNSVDASTIITGQEQLPGEDGVMDTEDDEYVDIIEPAPRNLTKVVATGWTSRSVAAHTLISDILSLWGMDELGNADTGEYVLSMSHDFRKELHKGTAGICTLNSEGQWVNAVTENIGGSAVAPAPVFGPYDGSVHTLGDWGIDPKTKTVWAVLNYNADFAIAKF